MKEDTGIKVGDLMTREFVHATSETDLLNCARIMIKKRVGSLILKENDNLSGILTEHDVLWALIKKSKKGLENIKARDIATKKVLTIKPEADLSEALDKMNKKKTRRLPVVFKGKVIGLITIKDILKFCPALLGSAEGIMEIKEISEKQKRYGTRQFDGERRFKDGMCEECGNFDLVSKIDGRLLCEACIDAM